MGASSANESNRRRSYGTSVTDLVGLAALLVVSALATWVEWPGSASSVRPLAAKASAPGKVFGDAHPSAGRPSATEAPATTLSRRVERGFIAAHLPPSSTLLQAGAGVGDGAVQLTLQAVEGTYRAGQQGASTLGDLLGARRHLEQALLHLALQKPERAAEEVRAATESVHRVGALAVRAGRQLQLEAGAAGEEIQDACGATGSVYRCCRGLSEVLGRSIAPVHATRPRHSSD